MAIKELVIKIPDNYDLSKIQNGSIASKTILNAVANGIPLNEVFDKVRDELYDLADSDAYGDYQQGFNFGLMRAVQIIEYNAETRNKT